MKGILAFVNAVAIIAVSGCATVPASDPDINAVDTPATSAYLIAPGDVLSIQVYGHVDLSGEYTVNAQGSISMPLVNQVTAAGLTTTNLETHLIDLLQPDYLRNPDVNVKLLSYRSIYVLGEVQDAGSYPYRPNMSVLSAVALAGGYTYRASRKKLVVVRGDDDARREMPIKESETLRPGDTLIIRQRLF